MKPKTIIIREEFAELERESRSKGLPMLGLLALQKLLEEYKFETILDVGAGSGLHTKMFLKYGKSVTAIDFGKSRFAENRIIHNKIEYHIGDIMEHNFNKTFDCIWCCHVLEHQLNANLFLTRLNRLINEGGVLAITVPPAKSKIVGGHVSLWNIGLLLYNLVLAGFNCRDAIAAQYSNNLSILVQKESIDIHPHLVYDTGDIMTISKYLPKSINFNQYNNPDTFEGNIQNINWF